MKITADIDIVAVDGKSPDGFRPLLRLTRSATERVRLSLLRSNGNTDLVSLEFEVQDGELIDAVHAVTGD